jgi:hypothetical protein
VTGHVGHIFAGDKKKQEHHTQTVRNSLNPIWEERLVFTFSNSKELREARWRLQLFSKHTFGSALICESDHTKDDELIRALVVHASQNNTSEAELLLQSVPLKGAGDWVGTEDAGYVVLRVRVLAFLRDVKSAERNSAPQDIPAPLARAVAIDISSKELSATPIPSELGTEKLPLFSTLSESEASDPKKASKNIQGTEKDSRSSPTSAMLGRAQILRDRLDRQRLEELRDWGKVNGLSIESLTFLERRGTDNLQKLLNISDVDLHAVEAMIEPVSYTLFSAALERLREELMSSRDREIYENDRQASALSSPLPATLEVQHWRETYIRSKRRRMWINELTGATSWTNPTEAKTSRSSSPMFEEMQDLIASEEGGGPSSKFGGRRTRKWRQKKK